MEGVNRNFDGRPIDYPRDISYSQELAEVLQKKFSFSDNPKSFWKEVKREW